MRTLEIMYIQDMSLKNAVIWLTRMKLPLTIGNKHNNKPIRESPIVDKAYCIAVYIHNTCSITLTKENKEPVHIASQRVKNG